MLNGRIHMRFRPLKALGLVVIVLLLVVVVVNVRSNQRLPSLEGARDRLSEYLPAGAGRTDVDALEAFFHAKGTGATGTELDGGRGESLVSGDAPSLMNGNAPSSANGNAPSSANGNAPSTTNGNVATKACPQLKGAENVLLILRTSGVLARQKLPTYFESMLKCVPNFEIYSDVAETIMNHEINDAFAGYEKEFESVDDFAFHGELQKAKADGVAFGSLAADDEGARKAVNLNKLKIIPMLEQVYAKHRDVTWHVFINPDTYIVWPNLLEYLALLDPLQHRYIGSDLRSGSNIPGGGDWIMSNSTMKAITESLQKDRAKYIRQINKKDTVTTTLQRILSDSQIPQFSQISHIQAARAQTFEFNETNYCNPTLTYHHMSNNDIRQLWDFEHRYLGQKTNADSNSTTIRNLDILKGLYLTELSMPRARWDNLPNGETYTTDKKNALYTDAQKNAHESNFWCWAACNTQKGCLQFTFRKGECRLGSSVRLGQEVSAEVESTWMYARIGRVVADVERRCGDVVWDLP